MASRSAVDGAEGVAGVGDVLQAEHDDRGRRPGFGDAIAAEVGHRLDASPGLTDEHGVALSQGSFLHQQRGARPLTAVEFRFEHHAGGETIGIGRELGDVGDQEQGVEQVAHAVAARGRDGDERDIAAVFLDLHLDIGERGFDAVGVDVVQVHLVQRDDVGHTGGVNVTDRLAGLRHDAIVGGDDEDGDVGGLRAARAHLGEGRVARGVDEGEQAFVGGRLVGADALGDAASLSLGDVGAADVVEQRGLAVVDVSEHGHDGRSLAQVGRVVGLFLDGAEDVDRGGRFVHRDDIAGLFGIEAAIHGDDGRGAVVERLGDVGHDAVGHQGLDDRDGRLVQQIGEFAHGQGARNLNDAVRGRWRGRLPDGLLCRHGGSGWSG